MQALLGRVRVLRCNCHFLMEYARPKTGEVMGVVITRVGRKGLLFDDP
jgi:hypothetical protein